MSGKTITHNGCRLSAKQGGPYTLVHYRIADSPVSEAAFRAKIRQILDDFDTAMGLVGQETGPGAETKKLRAIAACCQELNRLHFFSDGNTRTVGMLVLNKLLRKAGFGMTVLWNPNRLDMYSIDEIIADIKEGWARAASLFARHAP